MSHHLKENQNRGNDQNGEDVADVCRLFEQSQRKSKANKMTALIASCQSYSLSLNKGAVSLDGSLTIDLIENSVMTERIK